ncbi:MAG: response regulator [bacterium]
MEDPRKRRRVLVCEDDSDSRLLICTVLQKLGYEVVGEADNGLHALNLFVEKKPDIVLLDIKMPLGDGLAVLRFIREIDTKSRVIMLTVDDSPHAVKAARQLGADDYVIKSSITTPRFLKALVGQPSDTDRVQDSDHDAAASPQQTSDPADQAKSTEETDGQEAEEDSGEEKKAAKTRRMVKQERGTGRRTRS